MENDKAQDEPQVPQPPADVSANAAEGDSYVKIKVISQEGGELYFKVKSQTVLSKLMKSYAERYGIPVGTLRFMYEGKRINEDETASSLGMDDEDCIEVYQEQVGGSLK